MSGNFKEDNSDSISIDLEPSGTLDKDQEEDQEEELEDFLKRLNIGSRKDERVLAFFLIYAVDRFDYTITLEAVVDNFSKGFNLDILEASFAYKLAKCVIEQRDLLDSKMVPYLKNWKLERLGCCTRLILRLALWELMQQEAIPSIVINEAVELAKVFAEKDAYKFINGILDEFCKQNGLVKSEVK